MNRQPYLTHDNFPLFHDDSDLWNRLDESVQAQVLDGLGLLLLHYISRTTNDTDAKPSSRKGNQP